MLFSTQTKKMGLISRQIAAALENWKQKFFTIHKLNWVCNDSLNKIGVAYKNIKIRFIQLKGHLLWLYGPHHVSTLAQDRQTWQPHME